MTDEHNVILKEYFCVYFTRYYKVDYLCLTDDNILLNAVKKDATTQ